jgi:LDH2 family malate/lactate/ureidoglycolate dehydrogenase
MTDVGYAGIETDRRIRADDLFSFLRSAFMAVGVAADEASQLSNIIGSADLRGVYSHGVAMVPGYLNKLRARSINPAGRPRVSRDDGGSALVVDGDNAMGHLVVEYAMQAAIARAHHTGVTFVAIGGSNHCGAMAHYPRMALGADMIGFASTNALPTMAPWGGIDRILGINPISVAVPANDPRPLVLDTSFGAAAYGKLVIHRKKGKPIPEGWAFDAAGNPTTDTVAALAGLLQPIGRFKGTGLALVMGILSTLLSGAAYGSELGSIETGARSGHDGQFVMALNVAAFANVADFKRRMDGILSDIRGGRRAPGRKRIYTPGEIEYLTEDEYRRDGIPINDTTLNELAAAGSSIGVKAPW